MHLLEHTQNPAFESVNHFCLYHNDESESLWGMVGLQSFLSRVVSEWEVGIVWHLSFVRGRGLDN